jgi:predicted enzyme related to lactoylglutathione lyase
LTYDQRKKLQLVRLRTCGQHSALWRWHGGTIVDPAHDLPEHGVRVGFSADPEGHLLELVELLAAD